MKQKLVYFLFVAYALSGCCHIPKRENLSFNISSPIEIVLSKDEPKVVIPIEIQNTSSGKICISKNLDSKKSKKHLMPTGSLSSQVQPGIDLANSKISFSGILNQHLKQGRRFRNPSAFYLEIKSKNGAQIGDKGTFWVTIGLAPEVSRSNYMPATVQIPIQVSYRDAGLPVLISQDVPYNSQ